MDLFFFIGFFVVVYIFGGHLINSYLWDVDLWSEYKPVKRIFIDIIWPIGFIIFIFKEIISLFRK